MTTEPIPRTCYRRECGMLINQSEPYYSTRDSHGHVVFLCSKCAGKGIDTTSAVDITPASNLVPLQANSEGVTGLTPGEQNELHTRQLVRGGHRISLQVGKLLKENRDNAYWGVAGRWESFSNYIESLGIGKSTGYALIACYEFQLVGKLTEEEILEIGIAKMGLLTSADKQGKMNDETIALAKTSPVRDFKVYLGHKVVENDNEVSIICPSCGKAIIGAKWQRKGSN